MAYQYDVAISFAQEDRNAALALSQSLKSKGLSVYYYPDNRADNVGYDLEERLVGVYAKEASYAVVLLSEHYFKEEKIYPRIEMSAIQERMESDPDEVYLLPVKMDKSALPYSFITDLVHLEWNYRPDEIAAIIKELIGKKLEPSAETTNPNSIIYSYGDQSMIISGTDITVFNTQIIINRIGNDITNLKSSGDQNVILGRVDTGDVSIVNTKNIFELRNSKDTRFSCPYCYTELDGGKIGKNICPNCKRTFFLKNKESSNETVTHNTLSPEDGIKYNKVLAHISNHLRDRNYEKAYQFCQEAEKIAPAEVATWRNFTLTEFLREITKEKNKRKSTFLIIRSIKSHIEKCKDHGISDSEREELEVDIANRLFNIEKSRIGSVKAQNRDDTNEEAWSRPNLSYLQELLRSYEVCYQLYDDTLYLKEYVKELTREYKWVIRTAEGKIINTPACGYFNAWGKINELVERIRKEEPDYEIPVIAVERFVIRKLEYFKINLIVSKTE